MGLFDRFSRVVQTSVQELLQTDDPEKLLDAAIHEMQKELGHARTRLTEANAQAAARREMVTARLAEADRFEKRAKEADADESPEEAGRLRAFQAKAKTSAQTLETDAVAAEVSAAELKGAIDGLEKTIEDARTKRTEVGARLKDLRQRAGPRISSPEPEASPPPPPRERTARDVERELHNMERDASVNDQLEALKRKMREGK